MTTTPFPEGPLGKGEVHPGRQICRCPCIINETSKVPLLVCVYEATLPGCSRLNVCCAGRGHFGSLTSPSFSNRRRPCTSINHGQCTATQCSRRQYSVEEAFHSGQLWRSRAGWYCRCLRRGGAKCMVLNYYARGLSNSEHPPHPVKAWPASIML